MLGAALATLAAAAGQTENFDYSTSNIGLHRNDSFAGQVCAGATTDTSAFDLLRGRHLLIDTLQWAPFDVIDPTHPDGWSGFDIDLLQSLASILGFTYDIQDMGYPDGATRPTPTCCSVGRATQTLSCSTGRIRSKGWRPSRRCSAMSTTLAS